MDGNENLPLDSAQARIRELAEKLKPTPAEAETNARRYETAMRERRAFLDEFVKEHTRPPGLTDAEEEERVHQNILRSERMLAEREKEAEAAHEAEKEYLRNFNRDMDRLLQSPRARALRTATTETEAVGSEGAAPAAAETDALLTGGAVAGEEAAGETLLGAAAEGGLEVGGTVGAAGGFEIPVWGWIATGVAAAAGVAYGAYRYYQHKHQAAGVKPSGAPHLKSSGERRHFNKAQLIETQHIVAGTATAHEVVDVQRELKAEGFDIGKYGKKHDGVDGIAGRHTRDAMRAAMERLESPSSS